MTDSTLESEIANVPKEPCFLDVFWHVDVVAGILPSVVMAELRSLLRGNGVDIVVENYRLKCVTYARNARLPFNVTLFKKSDGRLGIEFQRRVGDVLYFGTLYRRVVTELKRKGIVPKVPSDLEDQESFDPFASAEEIKTLGRVVMCLKAIASGSQEAQVAGLVSLANDSEEAPIVRLCMENKIQWVTLLTRFVRSNVEDVHRCAVTILANLSGGRQGDYWREVCRISATLLPDLLTLCGSECAQVVRETARLVANLVESQCVDLLTAERFVATLTKVDDDRIRGQVARILAQCRPQPPHYQAPTDDVWTDMPTTPTFQYPTGV